MDNWTTLRIFAFKSVIIYNENNIIFDRQWIVWTMHVSLNHCHYCICARKKSRTSYSWKSPDPRLLCCYVWYARYDLWHTVTGMVMSSPGWYVTQCILHPKLLEKTGKQNVWQYGVVVGVVYWCCDVADGAIVRRLSRAGGCRRQPPALCLHLHLCTGHRV